MGNSGEARFLPLLHELAGHEDSVVAESARWALQKLEHSEVGAKRSNPTSRE
jgi:hypothetical protein